MALKGARSAGWPLRMPKRCARFASSRARRIKCRHPAQVSWRPRDERQGAGSTALRPWPDHGGARLASTPKGATGRTWRHWSRADTRRGKGHLSGALILKPCKFAVKPVCDRRTTAHGRVVLRMYTRSRA